MQKREEEASRMLQEASRMLQEASKTLQEASEEKKRYKHAREVIINLHVQEESEVIRVESSAVESKCQGLRSNLRSP